ncbi:MAG: LacI family transcriptional regulator [Luteococcus sp.]|uniref:LacI family DNA-binding transcriptional regulator n=1 Tax=Luteococcus sp. TaxID=1969402 RepID=UPI002648ED5F|nr:LacI family DNA-binding transcriptional regulator [Luteococcus sp.]MDN5563132.1 LacI family transcriptional regulator [Luteococcus sp.]
MRRTTIKDIARVAGVSPGAVSFALNDRPGVSEATRARVKAVAAELGWTRSAAAAALSGRRAGALGLVLQHGEGDDHTEAFTLRFIAGVHRVLRPLQQSLVVQMVTSREEELQTYRTWWGERRVDGVLVLRPVVEDPRIAVLQELGMPAVMVGGPIDDGIGAVCADEERTTRVLVDHLAQLGHRRLGYIAGPHDWHYVRWRTEALRTRARQLGLGVSVVHVNTRDEMAGMQASMRMLRGTEAPTAVIYDNELLTIGGVAACHDAGLTVGRQVCMASFEDSPALRMQRPGITALRRRSEELGAMAATAVLALADGGAAQMEVGPMPELAVRASSGRRQAQ